MDAKIRYRYALDNSKVSDTFTVPVIVEPKPASSVMVSILPSIALIALIGIGAGYYLLVIRKKERCLNGM
ncbi:MAG: S-layer protein, partial [Methanomicrobiales archaeon]